MSRAEELTQAIMLTLIELTECNAKTSLPETSLLTSAEFYVYFSDAMVSGNLLLSLVHTSQVVEVMKSITQSLPESLALPPAILFDEMLSHIPVKVGVNAGHVILVMTVPIIKKPRHYFTVKMITHPLHPLVFMDKREQQIVAWLMEEVTKEIEDPDSRIDKAESDADSDHSEHCTDTEQSSC
ncbi:unnamed protein product [Parnassius apollo]|uniref:(apollo) hypothetical protein n=1 Tax=Parnassius apollo TaxID=110799 RepID=A0A8S3XDL7_PARAO|nr:unnamed protein product [Parnassius apollo]